MTPIDLLIIGGGINGTGIAADAAGRGLQVTLCEQGDLASNTSSKSSKLIHGGLRYLEHYEFRLVREALQEREILLQKAPQLISPLRFIMPYRRAPKPAWLLRLGLFLYDHLAKRHRLPASSSVHLSSHPAGGTLKKTLSRGFIYSDCRVDDARLVVLNALAAKENGATILTRTRFVTAKRAQDHWEVVLEDVNTHEKQHLHAKVLVNVAGAWAEEVIHERLRLPSKNHLTLVKGSHIIVPKLYEGDFAFILSTDDQRVVFVIPYLEKYSLIGTTETAFQGNPLHVNISPEEIHYLCTAVNQYFTHPVSPQDVIWTYAGIRPLHATPTKPGQKKSTAKFAGISRGYTFELNQDANQAPLLSVFGGKITTYRKLAEHALLALKPFFPQMNPPWTAKSPLPGGDMAEADFSAFLAEFYAKYPWLPSDLATRYAHSYGTRAHGFLKNASCLADLGQHIGAGLYQGELDYLLNEEWARTVEDVLWRRTKLGLEFSGEEIEVLERTIRNSPPFEKGIVA